ncbi:hypothetical protein AB870_26120 [Pandoraea faecigallinarum]|uniref:Phosphoesterase HXTX domain-containing protein n=1 Tax=Pandoraea faecigallinarum TaxID=656179 RepID=A0A173H051_9BURK|nr:2'-5' RNA ligase family protein [Pandoraea faecigallinarum]ANI21808.1 hypothetical protein AB870_26120 [Pandoraea faecigallinarum]
MRLFLALWPGPGVRAQLHDWARSAHEECGGRVLRAQTLHLTLAFLDEVDPARLPVLLALMQRTPLEPFTLTLDHLGYWSDRKIVWAGAPSVPDSLIATPAGRPRIRILTRWSGIATVMSSCIRCEHRAARTIACLRNIRAGSPTAPTAFSRPRPRNRQCQQRNTV